MRLLFFSVILTLLSNSSFGQNPSAIDFEQLIEQVLSFPDNDLQYEARYEALLLYFSNPLVINKASKEELRALYLLSEAQINSLIDYRKKFGPLLSLYELQAVPGLDIGTIYKLLPFITVVDNGLIADNTPLLKRILNEPNNYMLLRYERTLEQKKGYTEGEGHYKGSPDKLLARFRSSHTRDFSIGFTAEKDAGEAWGKGGSPGGADFYSFHFQLQNKGQLKNLVIGDYKIQFGQSLILAAGFSIGKGAETITTTRRSSLGIRPYTSVLETDFFRGAAATISLNKNFEITTFYSRLAQDASVKDDNTISAIKRTGLHRTPGERASKDQVKQQAVGGDLRYYRDDFEAGISFVADYFSNPIHKSNQPYRRFDFHGATHYNAAFSYNYIWQNFTAFGEAAAAQNGGMGALMGLMASLTSKLDASVVLRNYTRKFHSFHGNAFSEASGGNSNEKGWYWGIKFKPSRKYKLTAYFDRFVFPWLKFGIHSPSDGHELMLRANYQPTRSTNIYFQYRQESKAKNPGGQEYHQPIKSPANGVKRNYSFNFNHPLDKIISVRSRILFSTYKFMNSTTKGYAILQDFNIDINKFRLSTRFALFDTDDYENRQYAYERDVLYGFSIPQYSGRGSRQYLLLQYKASRKIDLWVRYARTHYRDRKKISSGLEEINGNIKTAIKVQARIRF